MLRTDSRGVSADDRVVCSAIGAYFRYRYPSFAAKHPTRKGEIRADRSESVKAEIRAGRREFVGGLKGPAASSIRTRAVISHSIDNVARGSALVTQGLTGWGRTARLQGRGWVTDPISGSSETWRRGRRPGHHA